MISRTEQRYFLQLHRIQKEKLQLIIEAEKVMQEAQEIVREMLAEKGLCVDPATQEIVPIKKK